MIVNVIERADVVGDSEQEQFPQSGIDRERPSVARVYDYYLGGTANWPVDRRFGDKVLSRFPLVRPIAKANRLFLHRAVRHLMRLGVRQFIDLGSGVPTMGATHAVADELAPGAATVVYVDNEPDAIVHARILIEESGDTTRHTAIHADLRDADRLWRHIDDTGLIDLTAPVGLLMIAVLHIQQLDGDGIDAGPRAVARYRELLSPGSYLAISHATKDGVPDAVKSSLAGIRQMYDSHGSPAVWRPRRDIADLFGDFELVEPGITWTPLWHPEESGPSAPVVTFTTPAESIVLAGIARKQ
jgi:hypothetical protein